MSSVDSILMNLPKGGQTVALTSSSRESRKWARIAAQLDRELGPVTFDGVPMRDDESVVEWRARNQAAIKAHLQGWDWADYREYWS